MNIWSKYNFSDDNLPSALELLEGQADYLVQESGGLLNMEIDTVQAQTEGQSPEYVLLYMLYVVAPKLGGYRRKILTVAQYVDRGKFPIDIVAHLIEGGKHIHEVSRESFLPKVTEILVHPTVQKAVEDLYRMSRESA